METRAPSWLRIVAGVALLWNFVGVYFYLVHVGAVAGPEAGAAEQAFSDSLPGWITGLWAIGVFAGAAGCLGLLLAKRWAAPLLLVSFVALIIEQGWLVLATDMLDISPDGGVLPAMIVIISGFLAWLGRSAQSKGWLS